MLTAYKNGKAGMADVLEADNRLRESEARLAVLREKEKPLLASFNTLLNRNILEPVVLPDSLPVYDLPDDYLKDSLLAHNATLKELELRQMAAAAEERAALKESLPMIGLGLNYSVIGRSDVPVEGSGRDAFMPMVTITLPVYRKKYQAAVKESQLMQQQYALQREAAGNELLAEYENAFFEAIQQRSWVALYTQLADQTLRAKTHTHNSLCQRRTALW
ncbi:MAG: hypothetical protein KatS3mg032_2207 [Cyclobacteriaceae bacterium]|nr:MAG: hypothetical protein KatS3mg032_2207 [Cyclobacteriaceae bacterium]